MIRRFKVGSPRRDAPRPLPRVGLLGSLPLPDPEAHRERARCASAGAAARRSHVGHGRRRRRARGARARAPSRSRPEDDSSLRSSTRTGTCSRSTSPRASSFTPRPGTPRARSSTPSSTTSGTLRDRGRAAPGHRAPAGPRHLRRAPRRQDATSPTPRSRRQMKKRSDAQGVPRRSSAGVPKVRKGEVDVRDRARPAGPEEDEGVSPSRHAAAGRSPRGPDALRDRAGVVRAGADPPALPAGDRPHAPDPRASRGRGAPGRGRSRLRPAALRPRQGRRAEEDASQEFPRQALHAERIAFRHPPTNEPMEIVAPVPRNGGLIAAIDAALSCARSLNPAARARHCSADRLRRVASFFAATTTGGMSCSRTSLVELGKILLQDGLQLRLHAASSPWISFSRSARSRSASRRPRRRRSRCPRTGDRARARSSGRPGSP